MSWYYEELKQEGIYAECSRRITEALKGKRKPEDADIIRCLSERWSECWKRNYKEKT